MSEPLPFYVAAAVHALLVTQLPNVTVTLAEDPTISINHPSGPQVATLAVMPRQGFAFTQRSMAGGMPLYDQPFRLQAYTNDGAYATLLAQRAARVVAGTNDTGGWLHNLAATDTAVIDRRIETLGVEPESQGELHFCSSVVVLTIQPTA